MSEFEEALARSACAGDRDAFAQLTRLCWRSVYVGLYLQTGDRELSEDLVQETMLTALQRIRTLDDPRTFRSWLGKVARNTALDAARHAGRRRRRPPGLAGADALDGVADTGGSTGADPADSADVAEQRAKVMAVLSDLPEEYRKPIALRYLAGADHDTIGRELGLTNGSLRGLLHRGLKLLREKLEGPGRP